MYFLWFQYLLSKPYKWETNTIKCYIIRYNLNQVQAGRMRKEQWICYVVVFVLVM
ncbi:hypothetical protein HanPSC8_Chr01g0000211 [Helianthus annuus]|nr:hypothetical protein HanPSC8_Chr01g0000211 [Helianthus annuus]